MDDLISRQDAIDALAYFTEKSPTGRTAQEVVKALPSAQQEITEEQVKEYCEKRCLVVLDSSLFHRLKSAQPERKNGKWLIHPKNAYCPDREEKTCSACGMSFVDLEVANYCPNCGALMEGEEEW